MKTGAGARLAAAFFALVLAGAQAAPAPGLYAAEFCVATGAGAASCGPAEALWQARGRLRLRISDIEYRLQLHSSQLDVVLMHGTMQIDGFFAPYEWVGGEGERLRFDDREKGTRYEVRFGRRRGARP